MFNANHLQEAAQQVKQNKRSEDELYQQACEQLTTCINSNFTQSELLAQTMENFADLLQKEPTNPRAFVALGYIFIMGLQQYREAQPYLDYALNLDPHHPTALELKRVMSTFSEIQAYADLMISPAGEINYDQLYDETEQQLITQVQFFAEAQSDFVFSLEPEVIDQMLGHYNTIRNWITGIEQRISIIDQEIDTSDLSLKLKQLETLTKRFAHTVTFSQVLVRLNERLESWIQRIQLEIQTLSQNKSHPLNPDTINSYLDQTDVLADQLDALEQNGVPIHLVLDKYNALAQIIEKLQDTIDG